MNTPAPAPFRSTKINRRQPGIPSTAVTNELADAVNFNNPSMLTGSERPNMVWTFSFPGIIVDAGPDAEADYPAGDERYWVEPQALGTGGFSLQPDHSLTPKTIITVVNLAEMHTSPANPFYTPDVGGGIHQLNVGDPVQVKAEVSAGGKVFYSMQRERPPASYPVRLTQDGGTGGGSNVTPSWTYSVENLYGGSIDSNVTPENNRVIGYAVAASIGFYVVNGTNQALWTLDELPDAEACS